MSAAYEAGGSTNMKRQKTEFQKKKTEQMFSFMVNAFKAAKEKNSNKDSKETKSDKKRKADDSFAFDDSVFDHFNIEDLTKDNNDESDSDSDE
jgi:hypothetical protein